MQNKEEAGDDVELAFLEKKTELGANSDDAGDEEGSMSHTANQMSSTLQEILDNDGEIEFEAREVTSIRGIISYLIFLASFCFSMWLSHGDHFGYFMLQGMSNELVEREFSYDEGERNFLQVSNVADIYLWLRYPFLPAVLNEYSNNGDELPETRKYTPNFYNKMIGGIRIRQVRVKEHGCEVPATFAQVNFTCWSNEYLDALDPRWSTGTMHNRYPYMTAEETNDVSIAGRLGLYPASGYVVDLPRSFSRASQMVDQMEADNWIDAGARAVIVRFWTYNPELNMVYQALLYLEMPMGGGIIPKAEQHVVFLNKYSSALGYGQVGVEIIVLLSVVMFVVKEGQEVRDDGIRKYLKDWWNIIDWANILLLTVVICLRIATVVKVEGGLGIEKGDKYVEISKIVLQIKLEDYVACFVSFLLLIKLMKILGERFPRVNVFGRMFTYAIVDILLFFLLLLLFLFAFAFSGYVAFSSSNVQFRSLAISFQTLIRGCFGEMDYTSLEVSNRLMGPLFFFLFNICIVLITVNVFIAIMGGAWEVIRQEEQKYNLRDFLQTIVKGSTEKAVDPDEFFEAMQKVDPAISRARSRKIFDAVDLDGSGTIDKFEMKKVEQMLSKGSNAGGSKQMREIQAYLEPQDIQVHNLREDMNKRLTDFDNRMKELLLHVEKETQLLSKHTQQQGKLNHLARSEDFQKYVASLIEQSDRKLEDMGSMFASQFKNLQALLHQRRRGERGGAQGSPSQRQY